MTGARFVGHWRAVDWGDFQQAVQPREVSGVSGVQWQPFGDCGGGDHKVYGPPSRLASCRDDGGADAPVDARGLGVERHRVELALGPLQDFQAAGALGVGEELNSRPSGGGVPLQVGRSPSWSLHQLSTFGTAVELSVQVDASELTIPAGLITIARWMFEVPNVSECDGRRW
jgi:hypothetical protein